MTSPIRAFREKLDAGRLCLGAAVTLSDPAVTEALGPHVDFLWIDLEHSPMSLEAMQAHLIAARATATPALVRVPQCDVAWIKRVLDAGADGIIVPQIRSAAEARDVVANCRYFPLGSRGYGPRRAARYGQTNPSDYLSAANNDLFVTVQIENVAAVAEIDEIVRIPHLNSIALGPWDLSYSMGSPGEVTAGDVLATLKRVVAAARAAGKNVGTGCGSDPSFAAAAAGWGVQWIQLGGDVEYLQHGARNVFEQTRTALRAPQGEP